MSQSQIKVGRCMRVNGKMQMPRFQGYESIIIITKSYSRWADLSPYELRDEKGRIMENLWQYQKAYPKVPKSTQYFSNWDHRIIWQWPAETHVDKNGNVNRKYLKWRKAGMSNPDAVRYPCGFKHRRDAIYSLREKKNGKISKTKLNYIQARKRIYLPVYCRLARRCPLYEELVEMLNNGKKLLIVDVDGPHEESLEYYMEKYNVSEDFIEKDCIDVTLENMKILLNDPMHSFGHGYCLGLALLDLDKEIL